MSKSIALTRKTALLFVMYLACACACTGVLAEGLGRVESVPRDVEQLRREQAIMDTAGMDKWPRNDRLTVAPVIDRSFLSRGVVVTQGNIRYDTVVLDNVECGLGWIVWRDMQKSDAPLPTELPTEMQDTLDKITSGMSDDARRHHHDETLDRYRQSKAIVEKGRMDIKMVAAGSDLAAQEWLIFESTQCSLPTEAIAAEFAPSRRVADLGDIAFRGGGIVRIVRGNIAVVVRGTGTMAAEVERLAANIDAAIANEPAVADLKTMRPTVTVGAVRESAAAAEQKACPVNVTAPGGQIVASINATANGTPMPVKDGEILLGSKKGQLTLRISAITDRLMVTNITTNALLDDK